MEIVRSTLALSRSFLKTLGLSEDQVSAVIDAHSETVTALTRKVSDLESRCSDMAEKAGRLPELQKELDDLKKDDFKSRYEAEKSAHDALKETVSRKEARVAKEKALRAYYEGKNIRGGNLSIAMRATDLDSLQLDDSGRLSDTKILDDLVAGDFKPLVTTAQRTVSSGGSLENHQRTETSLNESMNRLLRGN
ncbi:MAG: hypothetical protein IJV40_12850 [Oscillospiraceae bacterium]|nr:hypothetical protein [Oscillospiraceae bacterium]